MKSPISRLVPVVLEVFSTGNYKSRESEIKTNTAVGHLSETSVYKDEKQEDAVKRIMSELDSNFDNNGDPQSPNAIEVARMGELMSTKIADQVDRIGEVRKEVCELTAAYEKTYLEMAAKEPILSATDDGIPDATFDEIDYKSIDILSKLQDAVTIIEARHPAFVESGNYRSMTGAFVRERRTLVSQIKDVRLSNEQFNTIVSGVTTLYPHLDVKKVRGYIQSITSASLFQNSELVSCFNCLVGNSNSFAVIDIPTANAKLWNAVNTYLSTRSVLEALPSRISSAIENNVYAVRESYPALVYGINIIRDVKFSDTVLFPNKKVNPDVWSGFIDAGGSGRALANHLKMNVPGGNLKFRTKGLTTDNVLSVLEATDERIQHAVASNTSKVSTKRGDISANAFITTTARHVVSDPSNKQDADRVVGFAKHISNRLRKETTTIEDAFYNVVIDAKHRGTLTETLYQLLGREMINSISVMKNITQQDIHRIETKVAAKIASNFMKSIIY